jgi:hypothetical protein
MVGLLCNQKLCIEEWREKEGVIRSCKSKDRQYNVAKRERMKWQTIIYKILYRKLNIEQQKPHLNRKWTQIAYINHEPPTKQMGVIFSR